MNKNYWFYLEPEVFIFQNEEEVILYNSSSKELLEFTLTTEIFTLIKQFLDIKNLYVISLTSSELSNVHINNFVITIKKFYFGDILSQQEYTEKPVIIPPILKIHKDIESLKKDHEISTGENILSKLAEVSLFLNGRCRQTCFFCNKMHLQFDFCYRNDCELNINLVTNLLHQLQYSHTKIIFTGSDIFSYSYFDDLVKFVKQYNFTTEYCFHYLNFNRDKIYAIVNDNNVRLSIYVTTPINLLCCKEICTILKPFSLKSNYIFVVHSESDLKEVQNFIDDNNICNTTIRPFYSNNFSFFSHYVFTEKSDIISTLPTKQEIYARQSFNTYDFGKLFITCNGEIFANVNSPSIGMISENIREVILREFLEGKSWLRIRNYPPCNKCVYQWLCPSPSNYELAMEKANLCHVKP
jgi:pseudo-rSAM protein